MSKYIAAIDDSGGGEPLVTWNGKFVPGKHPISVLSVIFLNTKFQQEFEEKWLHIRKKIQRELKCEMLPPIHLRLMYGRTLPKEYRGFPNPYLKAKNFDQIVGWIEDAYRLIWTFSKVRGAIGWMTFSMSRSDLAKGMLAYHSKPELRAELRFLKEKTRLRRGTDPAEKYHKKISSPLIPLMIDLLLYLNFAIDGWKSKSVDIIVDPFPDAHGFDTEEVLNCMRGIQQMNAITSIERTENADEVSLVQAADLLGFFFFREQLFAYRNQPSDPILKKIVSKYKFVVDKRRQKSEQKWQTARVDIAPQTQAIHYLIAKQQLLEVNPEFVNEFMIDGEELTRRYLEATTNGSSGISFLKDPSVCSDFFKDFGA
jgi:hypothetical protein